MVMVAALGAVTSAVLFFAMGGFAKGARPTELVAFVAGLALVAAVALTRIGTGRGKAQSMLGRPRNQLIVASLLLAPSLTLVAVTAAVLWPESAVDDVGPSTHLVCGLLTLVQGALPLAAFLVGRSGTDPVHPAVTGGALGTAAGAWTAMMAYLRCPHSGPIHGISAHVVPTLLLTVAGVAMGGILVGLRRRPPVG
jgi:hypothetical protein